MTDFNASAIAENMHGVQSSVDWNGVTVLVHHKNLYLRLILESHHIRKQPLH